MQFGSSRVINPDAGDHAVSTDPLEQKAAEVAIRASWHEFPYYAKRYGERGWRFSLSDTGWIQTLCHFQVAESRAQVRWLAGLLASRGMPSYLLERHLELLHQEMLAVAPERAGHYLRLLDCAALLRETRLGQIPEPQFLQLASEFERQAQASATRVTNVGVILVAAVADERAGIVATSDMLESWLTDPAMFDATWIGAIRNTLQSARKLQTPEKPNNKSDGDL